MSDTQKRQKRMAEKRNSNRSIRFDDDERALLTERAKRRGMTFSQYVRWHSLHAEDEKVAAPAAAPPAAPPVVAQQPTVAGGSRKKPVAQVARHKLDSLGKDRLRGGHRSARQ